MAQGTKIRSPEFDEKVRSMRKKFSSIKIAKKLGLSPGMVDSICTVMPKKDKAPRDILVFGIHKSYKIPVWNKILTTKWLPGFITEDFINCTDIGVGNSDNS